MRVRPRSGIERLILKAPGLEQAEHGWSMALECFGGFQSSDPNELKTPLDFLAPFSDPPTIL